MRTRRGVRPLQAVRAGAALLLGWAAGPARATDTCATAAALADPGSVTGDTTGAGRDYEPGPGGCTGSQALGGDHAWVRLVAAQEVVDIDLVPLDARYDASLYLMTPDCSAPPACAVGADLRGGGAPESLSFRRLDPPGPWYVIVDGYDDGPNPLSSPEGPYRLDFRTSVVPDDCASARVPPRLAWEDVLDTWYGQPTYDPAPGCGLRPQVGADLVYAVTVPVDTTVDAYLSPAGFDASLYALADCAEPRASCLAGSDRPGPLEESIAYLATAGSTTWIVVDSSGPAPGSYDLRVVAGERCAGPNVVRSFPFSQDGDTAFARDDVRFPDGACIGSLAEGHDVVYELRPGEDTWLDLRLEPLDAAFDPALYVLGDCTRPDTTCRRGSDAGVDGEPETLEGVWIGAGEALHVVVDSWGTFEGSLYRLSAVPRSDVLLFAVRRGSEVLLVWGGDAPPYDVSRDASPTFPAPPLASGEPGTRWTDAIPPPGLVFYRVD